MMINSGQLAEMVRYIEERAPDSPHTAVVLGSGLGHFTQHMRNPVVIPYSDIPHYPCPTVEGHSGQFVIGKIGIEPVLLASGRFHLYEGFDIEIVTLPPWLFHRLGVVNLIITNAAGSVRENLPPGTLMAISGHLDCTFRESCDPPSVERGGRYHSSVLLALAREAAERWQVDLQMGVYAWTLGPSFETPAEIEMIQELGGDAVGMSTVPEIRMAGELGLQVLGISCITNYAAGISKSPLTHKEVMKTANRVSDNFSRLLKGIIVAVSERRTLNRQSEEIE